MKKISILASAALVAVASFSFTSCNKTTDVLTAKLAESSYWGGTGSGSPETRNFEINLTTESYSEDGEGNPTNAGGYYSLDLNSGSALNMMPDTGTYVVVQNRNYLALTATYGYLLDGVRLGTYGKVAGSDLVPVYSDFVSGHVKISKSGSTYTVYAELTDGAGVTTKLQYKGALNFTDETTTGAPALAPGMDNAAPKTAVQLKMLKRQGK